MRRAGIPGRPGHSVLSDVSAITCREAMGGVFPVWGRCDGGLLRERTGSHVRLF